MLAILKQKSTYKVTYVTKYHLFIMEFCINEKKHEKTYIII